MKKLKLIDLWIVIPFVILLGIGIVMVYSASFYNNMVNGGSTTQYLVKQALYATVGLVFCFFVYMLKVNVLKSRGVLLLLGFVTWASLFVLVVKGLVNPASKINGASAWINLGVINFQPLELAKLVFVLYLALILSNKQDRLMDLRFTDLVKDNLAQIFFLGTVIAMVIVQPDIGGAMILTIISLVLISASTIPSKIIITLDGSLIAILAAVMTFLFTVRPSFFVNSYQYQRFLAMAHPFELERKAGAQIVNSYYAISNGGIFGVGLGNSIQKRGYLPEPHTDFILAIISEELGIVGVIIVLGLLAVIVFRILLVGLRSKNRYMSLVLYGIATMLMTQIFLNVGGLLGYIPLTGVTLPFISYGGSSMIVLSIALGIALNLEATNKFDSEKLR
ncbi:FtsW/RodA/SpoVE family cell cycle protein [Companilactobacillus ginsenosidimutans]|uniref:Probable peptidoglycan glycosyltransferase FtsW n=1 Tax=Companilactobacillus ginsenosidimutans TaxID=1007676 RepID=A0A0H4QEU0_9LACO|nr:FtsW/RodA/SpoVE family cell cycle protein [Companilactobacillus ginsenosidimutans]AKP66442.1 cell division protein FtsW [Companilactobacillus ginsenosidimutans]